MEQQISKFTSPIGPTVLIERHMLDLSESNSSFAQTSGDRLGGKSSPMFEPPKPLFFRRGEDHTVSSSAAEEPREMR
jgi:hypothetical protein